MSARMPVIVETPDSGAVDVHEWLAHVADGTDPVTLGSSPLAAVCSAAVDPLEIAVALEVAGISHAVVTERYDRADVFSLADTLWNRIPLRPVPSRAVELPRSGDRRDLARGLLYAFPAVMLLALTSALDLELARWVLPLAISWGWGFGQVAAFVGYRVQGFHTSGRDATMVGRVIVGAVVSTCVLSTAAALTLGGGATAVLAATALVTYMVASAILLVRAEERWLALMLLPGMLASPIVLVAPSGSVISQAVAIVMIGGSFVAVVLRALRDTSLRSHGGGPTTFARRDFVLASGHLLHGVFCGLAISLVVIQTGPASPENAFARLLLPVPMLATLGVLEWQLHTFRARVARLIHTRESCREFPKQAWHQFLRSLAICVGSNATVAIAVVVAVRVHGGNFASGAMAIQCALGAAFFTDLIIVMFDRLDLVLRSWLIGFAVGLASLGRLVLIDDDTALAIRWAAFALVSIVLVSLLVHARTVVSAAMNY